VVENKDFIQLFFNKKAEEILVQDIENFISTKQVESKNLEFKGPEVIERSFKKITKTISGFANTEGGLFIIGIEEIEDPKTKEKYTSDKISWYAGKWNKERIEQKIATNITPIIPALIIHQIINPQNKDEKLFLINVPQSKSIPHYDEMNKRYYFRLNFETLPMPHSFVELSFGRRYYPDLSLNFILETKNSDANYQIYDLFIYLNNTGNDIGEKILIHFKYNPEIREFVRIKPPPITEIKIETKNMKYSEINIPISTLRKHPTEHYSTTVINCLDLIIHPQLSILIAILKIKIPHILSPPVKIPLNYTISAKNMKTKQNEINLHLNKSNELKLEL